MVVISTIIVVISAVSVYDYYSARNWQQVTSPDRNDVVFENRNQKYGAYTLRRDYDKRVMLILLSFISSIGISYGAFVFFREPIVQTSSDPSREVVIDYILPPKDEEPEKQDEKPQQKDDSGPKQVQTASLIFIEPIIDDTDTTTVPFDQAALDTAAVSSNNENRGPAGTGGGGSTGGNGSGKDKDSSNIDREPTYDPDKYAEFPGGDIERINFIMKKINFPEEGFESGGKCYIKFVVDKEGDISSVNVEKGVPGCESCDKEAIRVVKMMPRWKPAETRGKKVSSYFRMVINFRPN